MLVKGVLFFYNKITIGPLRMTAHAWLKGAGMFG
jgi:hypothetical protein